MMQCKSTFGIVGPLLCVMIVATGSFGSQPTVTKDGGYLLVYAIEKEARQDRTAIEMTLDFLVRRLDPKGKRGIGVKYFERGEIEITIPGKIDMDQLARDKQAIASRAELEFRIVANKTKYAAVIRQAKQDSQKAAATVKNADDKAIAKWVKVGKITAEDRHGDFRADVSLAIIRDTKSKEIIDIPENDIHATRRDGSRFGENRRPFEEYLAKDYERVDGKKGGIVEIEVLVVLDDYNISGKDLSSVRSGDDFVGNPCIHFQLNERGAKRFGAITSEHLPDGDSLTHLAIILDGRLLTAPSIRGTITERGQITGRFTEDEVTSMINILRAGQLPPNLKPGPIREKRVELR